MKEFKSFLVQLFVDVAFVTIMATLLLMAGYFATLWWCGDGLCG